MHKEGVSSRYSEFRSRIKFSAGFYVGLGAAAVKCVHKGKNSDVRVDFKGHQFLRPSVSGRILCNFWGVLMNKEGVSSQIFRIPQQSHIFGRIPGGGAVRLQRICEKSVK